MKSKFLEMMVVAAAGMFIFSFSSCKKEETGEIYFTTTSGSISRGGTTSFTIELSKEVEGNVELELQSVGTDPITFGSHSMVFMRDDSQKIEAIISPSAIIDTPGKIVFTILAKTTTVVITGLFDNFPHAAGNYAIKMTSAKNATIRQGSDTYSLQLSPADAVLLFKSNLNYSGLEHSFVLRDTTKVDTMVSRSGLFELQSFNNRKISDGTYEVNLNYAKTQNQGGNTLVSSITMTYANLSLNMGSNSLSCGPYNVVISYNPPIALGVPTATKKEIQCAAFDRGAITTFNRFLAPNSSPVYGNFSLLDGTFSYETSTDSASFVGTIKSDFFVD